MDPRSHLNFFFKNGKIWLLTKIGVLEATVKIVLSYGFDAWVPRKTKEDLLDAFQKIA